MTIWKFPFLVKGEVLLTMPDAAEILCVQMQGEVPCLWAIVDEQAPQEMRRLFIYGTGHPMEHTGKYIGTFQMHDGRLVWHVFDGGYTED